MKYNIGDHIITKKKHVCGSDEWVVLRTGAEIKIKCIKCNREIMVFKTELDKKIKAQKE
jgi:hypothetical protein